MRLTRPLRLVFGLEILALSLYSWHWSVTCFVGWGKGKLVFHISIFLAFLLFFALFLKSLLLWTSGRLSTHASQGNTDILRAFILSLSPILLLYLILLQHFVFLKDMRGYLLPISLAGPAYLIISFISRLKKRHLTHWNAERLPLNRLALLVFALSLSVYIFLASGLVFPPQPFTGDEPHYLLVTKSLIQDGDINLADNYTDQDYLDFYPGKLRPHAYPGKKGNDYLYSKHFPALPLLLVPAYIIGEKASRLSQEKAQDPRFTRPVIIFFSRLPLCLFTALLALVFFHLIFDVTGRKSLAVTGWALFAFTTPLIFYSQLIYPEIPVALIVIFVLRDLVFKKESRPLRFILIGAGIAALPWFGIKYIVLSVILFGVLAAALLRSKKTPENGKRTVFSFLPLAASSLLYLFFFWSLYGRFSPVSAYGGIPMDERSQTGISSILRTGLFDFLKRAAGYLLDQRVGIFIYTPLFILGIAGFFFLFKKKRKESLFVMAIFLAYGMFSAYYYWGGYCPPARPMIPILWILALFVAIALAQNRTAARAAVIHLSSALSFLVVWAGLKNPWILYNEDISSDYTGKAIGSGLFQSISNTFIDFQKWVPSFVRDEKINPALVLFWTAVIILVVAAYIVQDKNRKSPAHSLKMGTRAAAVFFLSLLLLTYIFFDIHLEKKEIYEGQGFALYFQDENNFGNELGGFWTKGERQTSIILANDRPAASIRMTLTGPIQSTTTVQVGPDKKKIMRHKRNGFEGTVSFRDPVGFRLGGEYLYTITIRDRSGFYPFRLDRAVKDSRYLGVFVKITL
jgi:hypothetical protein